jgi:hypothetical protein
VLVPPRPVTALVTVELLLVLADAPPTETEPTTPVVLTPPDAPTVAALPVVPDD